MPPTIITTEPTEPSYSGMPWWVKAISMFGVPAAIAMYLVWSFTGAQAKTLSSISDAQLLHNTEMHLANDMDKASQSRIESYLRILCVNQARTKAEQNTCLSVR